MPRSFIYRIGGSGTGLTQSEVDNNILCIYDELSGRYGWSRKAVAGACGCFYEESNMNPGIYETSHGGNLANLPYFPGGMGLAQWTDYPAYTASYPNPLPWAAMRDGYDWYDGQYQYPYIDHQSNKKVLQHQYSLSLSDIETSSSHMQDTSLPTQTNDH